MSFPDVNWSKYCPTPKVIMDIGAYDCEDSMAFKRAFPKATVYAFEASTKNYNKCLQNITTRYDIKLHNVALSDRKGEITFYESHGLNDASGSIMEYNNNRNGLYMHPGYTVPTTSIEMFCKDNNISEISIAHLDVQGAEHKVLSGLGEIKPLLVFAETCEYLFYKDSLSQKDLDILMGEKGYSIAERLIYDTLYIRN